MKRVLRTSMVTFMALGLFACAAPGPEPEEEGAVIEDRTEPPAPPPEEAVPEGAPGAEAAGAAEPGELEKHPLEDPDNPLAERVVYFDFDSSVVKDKYHDLLANHATYLAEHPDQDLIIEGHTDERGTREYNIGLGERRAQAVERLLLFQGASEGQIRTVSYGEEKPAVDGHNEEAWAKNRRVRLVYPGHRQE